MSNKNISALNFEQYYKIIPKDKPDATSYNLKRIESGKQGMPVKNREFGEATRNSSAPFIQRLLSGNKDALINNNGERETHLMASSGKYIFPMIQKIDGQLVKFDNWKDALNNAIRNDNVIEAPNKRLAKWYGENYKQFFPEAMFKKGGSIHIKPENKGKFTETKKRTGKTTEELTHSKNPITRKRAIFAQNAKKWNK